MLVSVFIMHGPSYHYVCVPVVLQMSYVLCCMREQWGGKNKDDCVRRMTKAASMMSGGIELG